MDVSSPVSPSLLLFVTTHTFESAPTTVEMQMANSSYETSCRPSKSNMSSINPAFSLLVAHEGDVWSAKRKADTLYIPWA